jgi:riboflavin synthase
MFNGIIKSTGKINKIKINNNNCVLEVYSNFNFLKSEIGSSISCSGACLTLNKFKKKIITFYISKETLNKTNFKFAKKGDIINLEKSMKYGSRISGHFVQGHVDTTSSVKEIKFVGKSWYMDFALPKKFKRYVVNKGSITINGVSLTIARKLVSGIRISVIPQTLKLTNLIFLKKREIVNVEFDVLAKYISNFLK